MLSKLQDGTFRHGNMLPSDNDLMRLFSVSRITAQRAISELVAADLAWRERGRGTRVKLNAPVEEPRATIRDQLSTRHELSKRDRSRLLHFEHAPVPDDIAARLQLPPQTPVIRSLAVQIEGSVPQALHHIYLPLTYGDIVTRQSLQDYTLYTLLSRAEIPITRVHQTIGASSAFVDTASELEVPVGAPLVRVKKLYFDHSEKPFFFAISLYKSHYEYEIDYARSKFGAGTDSLKPS